MPDNSLPTRDFAESLESWANATPLPETVDYADTQPPADRATAADWPTISGYAITAEIARGGMGRVFAGRDLALEREVAVKTLLPGAPAERFLTESKITARLPHPGIPPVHALGSLADGSHYLVMKLIRGRTLAALLKERTSPKDDLPRWVQVFEQIAQAVGFAHAQGIIHRDLKPLNVMVGAFGEVQVMDWGLAKELRIADFGLRISSSSNPQSEICNPQSQMTQAGAVLGTPGYMAPEQARGQSVDARADVFALGSILTAILTGKPAFVGSTAHETITKAAAADVADALARLDASAADAELIALARRCLAARAEDRPADARAVAEQVAAYRAGVEARLRQAETERAAAQVREAEQRKRRRQFMVAAGIVTAVLVAGIVGTAIGLVSAENEAYEKEQARLAEADAREQEKLRADGEARANVEAQLQKKKAEASRDEAKRHLELVFGVVADIDYRKVREEKLTLTDEFAARLVKAAKQLDAETTTDPLDLASLQNRIGETLLSLGHPNEAVPLFQKARLTWTARLGADHTDTLTSMNNLAVGYRDAGKLDLALPLYEETLKVRKSKLGADHPYTLISMNHLAGGYRAAGKLDLALPLYQETLKLRTAKLGADHRDTLQSMNNLALGYRAAGKLDLVLPLLEETLKLTKHKLGADHPDTLTSMNNLASGYQAAGKLELALPLYGESLKLRKSKLGDDHPDTLGSMNNLADGYRVAGKLDLALPLYQETLKLRTAKLGADHPDTLTSMNNLASGYRAAGKLDLALPLFEETLKLMKSKLGPDHPNTLTCVGNLAIGYCEGKFGDKAVPLFAEYFERQRRRLKPGDVQLAGPLASAAQKLHAAEQFATAEIYLKECLALREKAQPQAWITFETQSLLGGAVLGKAGSAAKKGGKEGLARAADWFREAEPLLLQGYAGMKAREKTMPLFSRPRLADAAQRVVELYQASGRKDDADKWGKVLAEHRRQEGRLQSGIHDAAIDLKLPGKLDAEAPALIYQVRLKAGVSYVIDLVSPDPKALDPYLFLLDSEGKLLVQDDDSGGNRNARISYRPTTDGVYRIRATSHNNGRGDFTLTVREMNSDTVEKR